MKTKFRIQILTGLILFLSIASVNLNAGNRSGTVSEQFLKISTSARAIGIGGAQVAVADGVSSIAFNPAGIMSVNDMSVGMTYTAWFADIQHSFIGVVKNLPGIGAVGVSVIMLVTDDMIETTNSFPEGTGRNFRASDYAFSIAYARQVTDQFRVGVNGKYIRSYLYNDEISASSFAFDIGTLYHIPMLKSHIGVSLTNIGKDVKFIQEQYSLPTALRFGVLVDILKEDNNQLITTMQIARLNDSDEQYNFGAEYVFNNLLALRTGWKFAYDHESFTGGFGVKMDPIGLNGTLDYGYNYFQYLPGTHSFTFELQF
ncbi:MAG: PorV/PorQ family protein [Ignavibacteriales bacterium]|nr:PorV/PorQ family protein [Ignavibacteriales bacterium]